MEQSSKRHRRTRARLALVVATIAVQLALLELGSFAFLRFYLFPRQHRFFYYEYRGFTDRISDDDIRRYASNRPSSVYWFDPELGWNTGPNVHGINPKGCAGRTWHYSTDSLGSRKGPKQSGTPLISLYGDSYTFGAEVNDDETWQYYLSELARTPVDNFGVAGYGYDQALLKLQRNYDHAKTPIVVFGIYSAGISRNLNAFRPFLVPEAGLELGFKPMLVRTAAGFEWRENPLKTLDRAAIERAQSVASTYDYYYRQNQQKPRLGFPYLWSMLQEAYYIPFVYERKLELWKEGQPAYAVTREIVRRFVAFSKKKGFQAVLVFMPEVGELQGYEKGMPPYYAQFFAEMERSYDPSELQLIDVYREKMDPVKFSPPGCHPTPYGNEIIARSVYNRIAGSLEKLRRGAVEHGTATGASR